MNIDKTWENIKAHEGEELSTRRGQPFNYKVEGDELIIIKKKEVKCTLTKEAFEKALCFKDFNSKEFEDGVLFAPYVGGILDDDRIK